MPETPESYVAGLQNDPRTGQLLFAMPGRRGKQTVDTTKSMVIETILSILKARDVVPDAAMTIKFIGYMAGKHFGGMILTIAINQLFDTALMQIFNTMSDVHMKAAMRELQLALDDPTDRGKRYHRTQADTHVGTAYETVSSKLTKLERQWFALGSISKTKIQAAYLALLKAFISAEAGLQAAHSWARIAWGHYESYDTSEVEPQRRRLRYMQDKLSELERSTAWFVTHPIYTDSEGDEYKTRRKTAIRDLNKEIAKAIEEVGQLDRDRQHFREICTMLTNKG